MESSMKKERLALLCVTAAWALSGCVPVLVTGAATTTGVVAAQERSAGNAVDDAGIKITLNSLFFNHDIGDLYKNVNIHVTEGRVLLTGAVNKPETKEEATKLAWQAKGVREVINEIQANGSVGIGDYARDTWICAQIRSKILLEKNVRSINYNVESVNGIVYLLGIAQDEEELRKVTYIASTTSYVKQVVSHVIMKDDPRRREYLSQQNQPRPAPVRQGGQPDSYRQDQSQQGGGQPESYNGEGESFHQGVSGNGQPESQAH
jgi:osmotically-inducible protein OsmY